MIIKDRRIKAKFFIIIILYTLVVLGAGTPIIYANGGPIDSNGLVEGGNIKFKEVDDIYIIEENLNITITRGFIDVNVEYLLSNQGQERELEYIFPIFISNEEHGRGNAYLDNVYMKDGDKYLRYEMIEKELKEEERSNPLYGVAKYQNLHSKLKFDKNEIKKLNISYRTNGEFLDWGISNTFRMINLSDNYFKYDLSPASNWGDGQADKFSLTVDYTDLLKAGGKIIKANLIGLNVNELNGVYHYAIKDYDFKRHKGIELVYSNKAYREQKYMQKARLGKELLKQVKVSSILKEQGIYDYGWRNVVDDDLETCWAEGAKGNGIGETIELIFENNIFLTGIGVVNGYIMDNDTYINNNRIKKLKIESIDSMGRVTADNIIMFDDIDYNQIDKEHIYNNMQVILDYGEGRKIESGNEVIRLTILDVYQGKKYDDTCISELLIYGFNSKDKN